MIAPEDPGEVIAVIGRFPIEGTILGVEPYGSGHINRTYRSTFDSGGGRIRYIHQKINTEVFRDPGALMENITRVTRHIYARHAALGSSSLDRRTLDFLPTRSGGAFHVDPEGGCWRTCRFIEGTVALEEIGTRREAFALGEATGRFHSLLSDLGGPRLHETIPNFHDARSRFAAFERSIREDREGRAPGVGAEIDFFLARSGGFRLISDELAAKSIPERVVHNDAKINNLLFDRESGEAICLIDLDTVMPGTPLHDFGDLVRTCASSGAEDEPDHSRIGLRIDVVEDLARGYAAGAGAFLGQRERELLSEGCLYIALEQGMRFLTDYLDGDRYYAIARPGHNLDRARTQAALAAAIEGRRGEMRGALELAFDGRR